jgi:hypothetical protein
VDIPDRVKADPFGRSASEEEEQGISVAGFLGIKSREQRRSGEGVPPGLGLLLLVLAIE